MIEVVPAIKSFYQTSSNQVVQLLGVILALRFIYISVTLQGHDGVIQAIKGVFSTAIFLYVFDHFFPLYLDQVASYIKIPSKVNFNYKEQSLLMMGISYIIAFVATVLNSLNTILIGCMSLGLAVLLPFSYVLSSVLSLDILVEIVKRLFTASFIWLTINYVMQGYGDLDKFDPNDPSSYYIDLIVVSLLSIVGGLASGRIQQLGKKGLEHVQSKYNETFFDKKKNHIKNGLESGKLAVNSHGEAVKRGLALDSNLTAVKEYQAEKGLKDKRAEQNARSQEVREKFIGKQTKNKNIAVQAYDKVKKSVDSVKTSKVSNEATSDAVPVSKKPKNKEAISSVTMSSELKADSNKGSEEKIETGNSVPTRKEDTSAKRVLPAKKRTDLKLDKINLPKIEKNESYSPKEALKEKSKIENKET